MSLKKIKRVKRTPVKAEPLDNRSRWTILGVEEEAIQLVKDYAAGERMQVGKALSKIIKEALGGD